LSADALSAKDGSGQTQTGRKALGWFALSGDAGTVTVGVQNFWQQFPKSFAIRDEAIQIGLCTSATGAPAVDQNEGGGQAA